MTFLTLENSSRALRWPREAAIHLLVICAVVVSQIVLAPAHDPNADATWLFRLALDMLHGRPIHWFGVDPSRFFPDLLFAMLGVLLSGAARFTTWLCSFYVIQFVACYLALMALATALHQEARERLAFCVLTVSALGVLTAASPYWCGWLLEPGSDGASLPICIALLALALRMKEAERLQPAAALVFVAAAVLLVASNRYLLVAFFVPLLAAFAAALCARGLAGPGHESGGPRGSLLRLIACIAIAASCGYIAWRFMPMPSWYTAAAGSWSANLPKSHYGHWLLQRIAEQVSELRITGGEPRQIRYGLVLLLAAVAAAGLVALRVLGRGERSRAPENRLVFGVFTAASALCGIAYVLVLTAESGPYRYRYLAVPLGFAVIFLASLPAGASALRKHQQGWIAAVLVGLVALAMIGASDRQGSVDGDRSLDRGVAALEQALRKHGTAPLRGFADYWMAHDVTARSPSLRILPLQTDKARLMLRNNNAAELCDAGFSFVLHDASRNEPKRDALVAGLGEPSAVERIDMGRYPKVEIFYYDPALLKSRVVDPSKDEARRLLRRFDCR